jgi:hypothetical protein
MEVLLATVTTYEITCMDLVCVFVPWGAMGGGVGGNLFFNKRNRIWITEWNCDPRDRESEPIVCIGGWVKEFGFVLVQSISTKVRVCAWERLIS